ncbi:hypothetical protein CPter291_4577 [Collimonas pratensis]|uniref:Uncharacterized protein n=1 Tax=Collimonas pratensis TaxID=279113 RepID=A0ABN4MFA4_9BURK|nr:hypothetical protein CPter291_4577 [Collimonas pratensis]
MNMAPVPDPAADWLYGQKTSLTIIALLPSGRCAFYFTG